MKKCIVMLLLLTMCVSLCACGNSAFWNDGRTVKLTKGNWNDYLEVRMLEQWGPNGCTISFALCLKDEYADKKVSDATDFAVEWSGTWVPKTLTCDLETKTYTIGDKYPGEPEESVTEQAKFHPNLLNLEYCKEKNALAMLGGKTAHPYYTMILENFRVISVSGTIQFA